MMKQHAGRPESGHRHGETLEKQIVNRPLCAFGVLSALLILAMLAVSSTPSTSRPSGVSAPSKEPISVPQLAAVKRPGGIYVIVMPAGQTEATDEMPARPALCRVKVDLAIALEGATNIDQDECHLGAGCLVELPTTPCHGKIDVDQIREVHRQEVKAEDVLEILHSLIPANGDDTKRSASSRKAAAARWARASMAKVVQSLRSASKFWRSRQSRIVIQGLRSLCDSIAATKPGPQGRRVTTALKWHEYASLMDEIDRTRLAGAGYATVKQAKLPPVRSGDWLLRFAASSLYQLGSGLQAAASQLQDIGTESAAFADD
jgi:hypothetical protein